VKESQAEAFASFLKGTQNPEAIHVLRNFPTSGLSKEQVEIFVGAGEQVLSKTKDYDLKFYSILNLF